jgi:hypothetical protein
VKKKNREFQSSDLVKSFARIHGFEEKLIAIKIKDFLEDYLDKNMFFEIESVNLKETILVMRIKSPLLKNDFRLRKSFFLKKFQTLEGEEKITDLLVL